MKATIFILAAFLCGAAYCNEMAGDCNDIEELEAEVTGAINGAINNFTNLLSGVLDTAMKPVFDLLDKTLDLLEKILNKVPSIPLLSAVIETAVKIPINAIKKVLDSAKSVINGVLATAINTLTSLLNPVLGILSLITSTLSSLEGDSSKCIGGVASTLVGLVNTMGTDLAKCLDPLTAIMLDAVSFAKVPLNLVFEALNKTLEAITDCLDKGIHSSPTCIFTTLSGVVLSTLNSVLGILTSLGEGLSDGIGGATTALTSCISIPLNIVQTKFGGVLTTVTNCASSIT